MSLTNVTRKLTAAERAREPRMLHVVAWFDGNARGGNPVARPTAFPRRLTTDEAASWREGWWDGRRERVCHAWHGFTPCPGDHPLRMPTELEAAVAHKEAVDRSMVAYRAMVQAANAAFVDGGSR